MNSVRTTVEIKFKGEVRDLRVTFDLMDKIRSKVAWEQIAVDFDKPDAAPNFTLMAKFIYHNLLAAGFKPVIEEIYDDLVSGEQDDSENLIALAAKLIMAYMPRGSKKRKQNQISRKRTARANQRNRHH